MCELVSRKVQPQRHHLGVPARTRTNFLLPRVMLYVRRVRMCGSVQQWRRASVLRQRPIGTEAPSPMGAEGFNSRHWNLQYCNPVTIIS